MIEHVWSVICRRSILDKDTNSISLIDILEAINYEPVDPEALAGASGLPLELDLVTLWVRADPNVGSRTRSRISLEMPTGGEVVSIGEPSDVDLREYQRLRARVHLAGMPFQGAGRYRFLVQLERGDQWETVVRIPLDVVGPNLIAPASAEEQETEGSS